MQRLTEGDYGRIRGCNFQGQIQFSENSLKISLTQFNRGVLYAVDINQSMLQKDFKRFLIFKKIDDLFQELLQNYKMEINDEESLVMPIEVMFKGHAFQLKIEIPLIEKKYQSQTQKVGEICRSIAKLNKYYFALEKVKNIQKQPVNIKQFEVQQNKLNSLNKSQIILFKGDQTNPSYKHFETNIHKIQFLATSNGNIHIYNHNEILPRAGIFHFRFKIVRAHASSSIIAGICGKNIKSFISGAAINSPYFMGYNLVKPYQYFANKVAIPAEVLAYENNISIFKVQINMNLNHLTWFLNDKPFYLAKIPKDLDDVYLYPFVTMTYFHDAIEFILHD